MSDGYTPFLPEEKITSEAMNPLLKHVRKGIHVIFYKLNKNKCNEENIYQKWKNLVFCHYYSPSKAICFTFVNKVNYQYKKLPQQLQVLPQAYYYSKINFLL